MISGIVVCEFSRHAETRVAHIYIFGIEAGALIINIIRALLAALTIMILNLKNEDVEYSLLRR